MLNGFWLGFSKYRKFCLTIKHCDEVARVTSRFAFTFC
jgi:hypothetical protein